MPTSRTFLTHRSVDVSRPDRLSSAEIASIVQAAGLQGMQHRIGFDLYFTLFLAVRKNRYVILPIDFEEAWKVRCLACSLHR
jgi:26S proteasome regulatory subunit T3